MCWLGADLLALAAGLALLAALALLAGLLLLALGLAALATAAATGTTLLSRLETREIQSCVGHVST